MNSPDTNPCEGLIDYIAGCSSDVERKRFEKHMAACAACREEAGIWRDIGESEAGNMDLIEPPADLKDEVLGSLLRDMETDTSSLIGSRKPKQMLKKISIYATSAALIAFVFFAGWFSAISLDAENRSAEVSAAPMPATIDTLYRLTAVEESGKFEGRSRAYGVACKVNSGRQEQLVVYVFDSPETQGTEAYQVWLWNKGERRSAGTFKVDSTGIGIMTLSLADTSDPFDAIGVTLEPDNASTSPRGPKMFGSDQADEPEKA
ncbi:anti-sigma factor [Cohnella panacarvi]|uniref:anti-sigma factor n=1 Tax=Cohnella panacarvi TaxID=400776 RepID=UPI0004786A47|nr:anti-sigma factor [Cohnella panacarvi]